MNDTKLFCLIGYGFQFMLMPLLKFLLFQCLFLLLLHIPPVQHVGFSDLDCTKVLWQKVVPIIGVSVLHTGKDPLTRD